MISPLSYFTCWRSFDLSSCLFCNLILFQYTHILQIINAHCRRHLVVSDFLHHKFVNFLHLFPSRKTFIRRQSRYSVDALKACHINVIPEGLISLWYYLYSSLCVGIVVFLFFYFFFMTASFGDTIDVSRMQAEMNNTNRNERQIVVVLV